MLAPTSWMARADSVQSCTAAGGDRAAWIKLSALAVKTCRWCVHRLATTDNQQGEIMAVFVAGGSKGIGRAIALELAGPDVDVVVGYRRDDAAAESLAAELSSGPPTGSTKQWTNWSMRSTYLTGRLDRTLRPFRSRHVCLDQVRSRAAGAQVGEDPPGDRGQRDLAALPRPRRLAAVGRRVEHLLSDQSGQPRGPSGIWSARDL